MSLRMALRYVTSYRSQIYLCELTLVYFENLGYVYFSFSFSFSYPQSAAA